MSFLIDGLKDTDPAETREWLESLDGLIDGASSAAAGKERARYLLAALAARARSRNVATERSLCTDFVNTIPPELEPDFPGDEHMEKRIRRIVRWNAAAMVSRANTRYPGLGGHLSTYASSASLYEVGFNWFFKGANSPAGADQVLYQGHAAPGVYARAFLEGRLTVDQLDRFRRETDKGRGLSSYPHPRLMPELWQFPTVSMGLGPLTAIYQARFNRYLRDRGIKNTDGARVWAFLGDGETDEPESLGSLFLAAREGLDNLTFVINCNLQRLDGPVRGNSKIIQELESVFHGAGWNVIKVVWGREWDVLLQRDEHGLLRQRMNEAIDGQLQKYVTENGAYIRKDFFGQDERLLKMVEHLSDEQIDKLRRGGHDYRKVYAAFKAATEHQGQPTVILAHTVKGWTLGESFEGRNATHQMKKMGDDDLLAFRDLLELPIPDSQVANAPFFHPGPDSPEVQYLIERRQALGGFVPRRGAQVAVAIELPPGATYEELHAGTREDVSTTMAFVRLLAKLLRDPKIGRRIVPIIPDEARTFGMESLFRQVGIYSSVGQLYEPVDKGMLLYYREAKDGQVLEEGITEAGSMASFTAAATSYSTHGQPMIPFYIFYSMFGYQRVADLIWAASDARARGFLLGATAGRTTLNGEGLQHQDGHSPILASTFPNVVAYDPAFAYEVALVVEDGMRRMYGNGEDVYYYITLQNENYAMPPMPAGVADGVLKGLYRFNTASERGRDHVQLFGSGSIMRAVLDARDLLAGFAVSADVWSATSYQQLRVDALACERFNRLNPTREPFVPYVTRALTGCDGPVIAASDYMKTWPDLIARWLPCQLLSLGTDGFGMSDTREALRRHFEVDAESIAIAALVALQREGKRSGDEVQQAIEKLGVDQEKLDPMLFS